MESTFREGAEMTDGRSAQIRRLQIVFAICLTVFIVVLHIVLLRDAGALWRDEANKAQLALLPSFSAIRSSLRYDSSPVGSALYFRVWTFFSSSDKCFRVAGLLVGIGIVGAQWWNARILGFGAPLFSLLLFAFNPIAVRYGDSVGPYGLGLLFSLISFGCLARLIEKDSPGNIIGAIVSAVLCVQCLYQTAIVVAAFCLAAGLTALLRKKRVSGVWAFAAGAMAAVSLLPDLSSIRYAAAWRIVQLPVAPVGWSGLWQVASNALGAQSHFVVYIWVCLCAMGIVAAVIGRLEWLPPMQDQVAVVMFAGFSLVFGIVGYAMFLHLSGLPTQVWYYLLIMVVSALCLDALFAPMARQSGLCLAMIALAILVFVATVPRTWQSVHERATNIDLAASVIMRQAAKEDLIIVNPWFYGISFNRVYRGQTPWMQVPPLEDRSIHRYDLVKQQMMMYDPIRPLLQAVGSTLSSGKRVWILGEISSPPHGQPPPSIPRAPNTPGGWTSDYYDRVWTLQLGSFIASHATTAGRLPIESPNPVSHFENLAVFVASGWRP